MTSETGAPEIAPRIPRYRGRCDLPIAQYRAIFLYMQNLFSVDADARKTV